MRRFACLASIFIGLVLNACDQSRDQGQAVEPAGDTVRIERRADKPIITASLDPSIGVNITGPSISRVPDWIENPLGAYYLYFADHKGSYIRLAYADHIAGPWKIHRPGSLQLAQSRFLTEKPTIPKAKKEAALTYMHQVLGDTGRTDEQLLDDLLAPHIASPDVHVDDVNQRIVMYFHGLDAFASQVTRVATSQDGLAFDARPEILGRSYWRVFEHQGWTYALSMPGLFYRSKDPLSGFEEGPKLFNKKMRHSAVLKRGDILHVFWTQVGDAPESILHSTIDLSGDWMGWAESSPQMVLKPEHDWEGANAPVEPSVRSTAFGHVNQLRDPAIFEEDGRIYLAYAVAGESGIALAEVFLDE
jgi:hypothetical protein